jgi:light-regulated signal transduction histidine kinase (bacteriophytochrome)
MDPQSRKTFNDSSTVAVDTTKTLTAQCEEEPIRIPGSIQRHGFLLVFDDDGQRVIAASQNAGEYLEVSIKQILGTAIETLLGRELVAAIRALNQYSELAGEITYLGAFPLRSELYSVITHQVDGQRVLEFEQIDQLVSPELVNAVITNFVGKLGTDIELCRAITKQVKDLSGFNCVLLYVFDEAGHGTVLTEESDGVLPSYLDLRFPASDIPRQARELYIQNTVRIIPNVAYIPSPLSGLAGKPMQTFDLSASVLRSVSPIHLEYMRNMGTMASMSISIVCEGRLWGLISCHHAEPSNVPYITRSACDLLTKMVSTQLMAFRSATQLERAIHFHGVQRRILTQNGCRERLCCHNVYADGGRLRDYSRRRRERHERGGAATSVSTLLQYQRRFRKRLGALHLSRNRRTSWRSTTSGEQRGVRHKDENNSAHLSSSESGSSLSELSG